MSGCDDSINAITEKIIGCAIEVHRHLGPGLLESAYERCLSYEIRLCGLHVEEQKKIPVRYKGHDLECGYTADLIVEKKIIVELKTVAELLPVHEAQLLTYMKLAQMPLGLLINFNTNLLKNGVKRFRL